MRLIIVIPAYNEEQILESNVLKLFSFCQKELKLDWQIMIVDNQSTDKTPLVGQALAQKFPAIKYLMLPIKGKGAAIKAGWQASEADIYCFMDADLATDLSALPTLVEAVQSGFDLVLASRFHPDSQVSRSAFRRFISFSYRLILKLILNLQLNDAPCGFKAINQRIKTEVLPQVKNQSWFFDSELVILSEKQGYRLKEIPVIWREPRSQKDKSRVKSFSLSLNYFREILDLRKRLNNAKK